MQYGGCGSVNGEIYAADPDGRNPLRLTKNRCADINADWSPDGRRIVFSSDRRGNNLDIYTMRPNGTNIRRLTTYRGEDSDPRWSPDGREIAYVRGPGEDAINHSAANIFVMRSDGSHVRKITRFDRELESPAWSPDGRRIAFISGVDVYVMKSDGSRRRLIVDRQTVRRLINFRISWDSVDWRPDPS